MGRGFCDLGWRWRREEWRGKERRGRRGEEREEWRGEEKEEERGEGGRGEGAPDDGGGPPHGGLGEVLPVPLLVEGALGLVQAPAQASLGEW